MKKVYIKPQLELFSYHPEKGFAVTVALEKEKDYVLIEGHDGNSLRTNEQVSEFTDNDGQYFTGDWE